MLALLFAGSGLSVDAVRSKDITPASSLVGVLAVVTFQGCFILMLHHMIYLAKLGVCLCSHSVVGCCCDDLLKFFDVVASNKFRIFQQTPGSADWYWWITDIPVKPLT